MKRILTFLLLALPFWCAANDGVYYADGNQLIPITETDISVRKEVLTITRIGDRFHVDVYYEFFNPTAAKTLLVGFEARDPYPCYKPEAYEKAYPNHPFIYNFTVEMNGKPLPYSVAHVDLPYFEWKKFPPLPEYYRDGHFATIDFKQHLAELRDSENYSNAHIDYAYHFQAHFQPGVNIIHHTYQYQVSMVNIYNYYLPYVLTAANRWANHQIDDFTLILDMGDYQTFFVQPYFYSTLSQWQTEGQVRKNEYREWDSEPNAMFHVRHGKVIFHKANFHPDGELCLYSPRGLWIYNLQSKKDLFNSIRQMYSQPWEDMDAEQFVDPAQPFTKEERRILRNLPFARRGYCFKRAALQSFYSSIDWYLPDTTYIPDLDALSPAERRWVDYWSK